MSICEYSGFDHDKIKGSKCPYCQVSLLEKRTVPSIMQITPNELIEGVRRNKVMKEQDEAKAKAPQLTGKDSYICPKCLKESLFFQEHTRLFECENIPDCGRVFALKELGYDDKLKLVGKE